MTSELLLRCRKGHARGTILFVFLQQGTLDRERFVLHRFEGQVVDHVRFAIPLKIQSVQSGRGRSPYGRKETPPGCEMFEIPRDRPSITESEVRSQPRCRRNQSAAQTFAGRPDAMLFASA